VVKRRREERYLTKFKDASVAMKKNDCKSEEVKN